MKRNNIFKSAGTFFIAGALATTFVACDSSERKGSTYDGAETVVESDQTRINEPSVGYQDGEYTGGDYDMNQDYTYNDRELVRNRLQQDIDRADRSLERLDSEAERTGNDAAAETRQERDQTRETLRRERDRLNQRLQEVENATEENWERVRNDVNNTLRDWEREWEGLRSRDVDVDVDVRDRNRPGTGTLDDNQ